MSISVAHYFGPVAMDGPTFDTGPDRRVIRQPTPVGEPCHHCAEAIADGESGTWWASRQPVHAECWLRQVMGSPAHLVNQCSCAGKEEPLFPGSLRDEAREVVRIVDGWRARRGLGPILTARGSGTERAARKAAGARTET